MDAEIRELADEVLGRPRVDLDFGGLRHTLAGKRVMVTGAGGSIGGELVRTIAKCGVETLLVLDNSELGLWMAIQCALEVNHQCRVSPLLLDLRHPEEVTLAMDEHRPDFVFHAAAYKHVSMMERFPLACLENNILGLANLLYACEQVNVPDLCFISTDKAVWPTNIMGASKRFGELLLRSRALKGKLNWFSTRFGNVFGSSGSVVQVFRRQINRGEILTLCDVNAKRFFMRIEDAALRLIQCVHLAEPGLCYVFEMGQAIRIVELADRMNIFYRGEGLATSNIREVGLQQGEKLNEHLFFDEKIERTAIDGIFVDPESRNQGAVAGVEEQLEALRSMIDAKETEPAMRLLAECVGMQRDWSMFM